MTQGNVEVVRGMYEAFHGGDAQRALDHFHPDVVLDSTRRVDGGIGRGREELAVTIGRWIGAFDDWHETIEEIRAVGEHVYVVLTQRGRGKGSGIETEARYATLIETRGEQITRLTLYPDPADALEQAGARATPS
ncbi:MAG: SnoaL-like polyketide cyclase [Frankiales bacterium]|jgi:ketosteroid isomerase-like protein|nr:SnoaL-like polyketide cyclase [Frankiales bacterium]